MEIIEFETYETTMNGETIAVHLSFKCTLIGAAPLRDLPVRRYSEELVDKLIEKSGREVSDMLQLVRLPFRKGPFKIALNVEANPRTGTVSINKKYLGGKVWVTRNFVEKLITAQEAELANLPKRAQEVVKIATGLRTLREKLK